MKYWLRFVALLLLAAALDPPAQAQPPVLQRGYDAGVSGANLSEVILNTSNVTPSTFGMVFQLPVDDNVYAQPLYVPAVAVAGQGTHNVVYVVTMSDSLYAFDADNGAQLWSANFASSVGATPVPIARFAFGGNRNIVGNLGILSTPVIDPSTHILYLVACTLEGGTMAYRLHAVDITTGNEPYPNALISASYGGVTFNAPHQTQRVSLTLSGNQVVFGFGAIEAEGDDVGGYSGWVMAYNKSTLAQTGAFASTTRGSLGGGVWQSGRPPVVDSAGFVYAYVGNGYSNYDGANNFNESALKLDPSNGLALADWFTPHNWSSLDANDLDLSSAGPLLIPNTNLLAGGGKAGEFYMLNTGNLGQETANDSGVVQEESITPGEVRGGPVFWQRSSANGGSLFYNWAAYDYVKAYAFNGTTISSSPAYSGSGTQIWPGGTLTLSANGDTPGTGVLWATVATSGDANNNPPVAGALYAMDAGNVGNQLWSSTTNFARDNYGLFAKIVPPLVVNGRVYVATSSNQVAVYGLLSGYTLSATSLFFGNQLLNVASAPQTITVTNNGSSALPINGISISNSNPQPFSQTNNCGGSVAAGGSCQIYVVFDPAAVGSATATLSVHAGNGAGTQTAALSGTGIVPTYSLSTASLAFGNQLANFPSTAQTITVTNTGPVALPIAGIALSTSGSQPFSQTNSCGSSVATGAHCTISVVFDPAAAGAVTATLSVSGGGGAATQTVALSGTGFVPTYNLSAAALAFGTQLANVASAAKTITVTNTGTVALTFTGIALSTPGSQPFALANGCGSSVAAGASCTLGVVFDPAAAGPVAATLSIGAGNGAATQTVALSGTGIVPTYRVSATSLAFGNQPTNVASGPRSITVTNTGTIALPITAIALSTPGTQPFSLATSCGASLAVGAGCSVNVTFDPAALGAVTAALSVSAGNGAGMQTIALSGTGIAAAYSVSAASLTFADQPPNVASTPQTITVTNTGTVALPITGIALSNSGVQPFAQTNTCGASIAAGAGCTVSVVFDPAAAGPAAATLDLSLAGIPITVNLSGSGSLDVALTASAGTVTAGMPITLTWSSAAGAACTATGGAIGDNWSGALGASGSRTLTETTPASVLFGISCTSQNVTTDASVTVAVTVPTATLSAAPSTAVVGKPVTLTWSSAHAAACVASGGQSGDGWAGARPTDGAATVSPSAAGTITYTLTCTSGPQSVHATAQVAATGAAGSSGGGALDTVSLLSLLGMVGLRLRTARAPQSWRRRKT